MLPEYRYFGRAQVACSRIRKNSDVCIVPGRILTNPATTKHLTHFRKFVKSVALVDLAQFNRLFAALVFPVVPPGLGEFRKNEFEVNLTDNHDKIYHHHCAASRKNGNGVDSRSCAVKEVPDQTQCLKCKVRQRNKWGEHQIKGTDTPP